MSQNDNETNQRTQQIQQLARQIQELSEQLNQLLAIEDQNEGDQHQQPPNPPPEPRGVNEFREGDRVQILNNYRGLRGATGTVINVTPQQVSIRLEGQNRIVNRKHTNVELVI